MEEIISIFKRWITRKIDIHLSEKTVYFKERDIWWVAFGQNIGYEQNGKHENFERPVLVLKKFNADTFWGIPISTKIKKGSYFYVFSNDKGNFSLNLSQLRLLSSKRLLRFYENINTDDFILVRDKIKSLL